MKIKLIELLGVFALSSRSKFIDYIPTCVQMSNYVCQLERDSNPIIVDKMRQKTLKMLSCIVIAVGNNSTLCETLPEIIFCLKVCIEDNNAYRNYDQECAGLIIDLYNAFQTNEVKDSVFRGFVNEIEIYNTVEKSLINQLKDVLEF
ncbi:hypothetical protein HERIO_1202 [Hepatospora eriocheir]|uniref:Uncharacterized protein n=1 Tax=Hepatospora eriocheir TaxID=1081669 RepID=A0A1X0QAX9_9MICR|nr:hypothetical protein HERIO_1202 [Hepatospora eriocheir]